MSTEELIKIIKNDEELIETLKELLIKIIEDKGRFSLICDCEEHEDEPREISELASFMREDIYFNSKYHIFVKKLLLSKGFRKFVLFMENLKKTSDKPEVGGMDIVVQIYRCVEARISNTLRERQREIEENDKESSCVLTFINFVIFTYAVAIQISINIKAWNENLKDLQGASIKKLSYTKFLLIDEMQKLSDEILEGLK